MWKHGESGPNCFCGMPTIVMIDGDLILLLCSLHTDNNGIMFPLPKERPENWPHLTSGEMSSLVDRGFEEQQSVEGQRATIDMENLTVVKDKNVN